MRKLLNTLFVTSEDAYLALETENVAVYIGEEKKAQYPLLVLESIISFSYKGASPALMGACARKGIQLTFLTPARALSGARMRAGAGKRPSAQGTVSPVGQAGKELPYCSEFHFRQGLQSTLGAGTNPSGSSDAGRCS